MPDSDGLDGQRSLIAGILWTAFGPTWAFTYLTAAMAIALVTFMVSVRRRRVGSSV